MHTPLFRRLPGFLPALQRGGTGLGLLLLGLGQPLAAQQQRAGVRLPALRPGSTRNAVVLDTLTARPSLYAVGVAEGGGEILVAGGDALTTRHRPDGATETTVGFQGRAVWLLQRRVARWREPVMVPATVTSPAQLARFVQQAAAQAGHSQRNWLPFRLQGEPTVTWWTVAAFPTGQPTDAPSAGLGAHGRFAQQSLDLVGFLLPTKRRRPPGLHLHARPSRQPFVAHVDSLRPGSGLRLLLPALPQ
ncbi:hypothetical protein E4631_20080 [Hymenobacter sp. UV11]|uniref:hypothetical protein n=1 Tax=Hymenobacter sp. UV11 TaxID=1849735 RepID=UPI00105BC7A5|nr:hypothetical protein [Hymenobacter sp. UV11]TDN36942.1 hypothetical protein A8B98_05990 [Hymenobacter sp. UV11]TFZ64299.1 hypothetical protein E4631_20080 [Hymenobacter sp. UV11]